jgi:hypothetical protein
MSHGHLNPDVSNTAARYVAKAMTRVNPVQRRALLAEMIKHAEMGLRVVDGGTFHDMPAQARKVA